MKMNNKSDLVCAALNVGQYGLTAVQTTETLQIVSLILSIISSLVILGFKVADWYHRAKKDGKIDQEEVNELKNIIKEHKDDGND